MSWLATVNMVIGDFHHIMESRNASMPETIVDK
jgi:hypothetical protein